MKIYQISLFLFLAILPFLCCRAQVERIWLTCQSQEAGSITVNWETREPGNSMVQYGPDSNYGTTITVDETTKTHRVEISLDKTIETYNYRVSTGNQKSGNYAFTINPKKELRVAVLANWHQKPNLDAILKDDIHLLLTAGDNIPGLHYYCSPGKKDCLKPYRDLIDTYPELFRSTLFMPVLGNHDREIRPRDISPPAEPVYDIDATAFRTFFPLPASGWKWFYSIPAFDVGFVGLDLNHITDQGNTWQSCHEYHTDSEQFQWYRNVMECSKLKYMVTLYNEKNERMRNQENGAWHQMFSKGTMAITGYGYYGERAEKDNMPYFNTSLNGRGDKYPDSNSKFFKSEDNYILLTFHKKTNAMKIEMKNLNGEILDQTEWLARKYN